MVVDLSYISRPSKSAVEVVCRANLAATYLNIKCPLLDDATEETHGKVNYSTDGSECQSTDGHAFGSRCTRTIRWIPWSKVKNVTNFECFCLVRKPDMIQNSGKQASVKVIYKGRNLINILTLVAKLVWQLTKVSLSCNTDLPQSN